MASDRRNLSGEGYELVDFGEGRKLERFGDLTLDRPSPAAESISKRRPEAWRDTDLRFRKTRGDMGVWEGPAGDVAIEWTVVYRGLTFRIRPNASGNVGVFPEAAAAWESVHASGDASGGPLRFLNLFAYTGGASLAAASIGAEVVHVDSSAASISVARENAALSGLDEAPIRWIVEDARKFTHREARRGRVYDVVLLDPPTWGHGPRGQAWRFEEDLDDLLDAAAALVRPARGRILLTGHAPGWDAARAKRHLRERLAPSRVSGKELCLTTEKGRSLSAGWMATADFAPERAAREAS